MKDDNFRKIRVRDNATLWYGQSLAAKSFFYLYFDLEDPKWAKNSQIIHLLDHMLCKESKNYPDKDKTNRLLHSKAIYFNAITNIGMIYFPISFVDKNETELALKILMDRIFNPLINKDTLEKEKAAAIQEMRQHYSSPLLASVRTYREYGKNLTIDKIEADINSIDTSYIEEVALDLKQTQLTAVVQSPLPKEKVCEIINANLSHSTSLSAPKSRVSPDKSWLAETEVGAQSSIALFYDASCEELGDYAPIEIIQDILADGRTSLLQEELRNRQSLVYQVGGHTYLFKSSALLSVFTACSKENKGRVINIIKEKISQLANDENLATEELKRYKKKLKYSLLEAQESSLNKINTSSIYLYRRGVSYEQFVAVAMHVTPSQIQQTARKILEGIKD